MKPSETITFLLIGAQKCASSWLYEMLRQHDDIYLPKTKELHFFDWRRHYDKGFNWYMKHFRDRAGESQVGEFTQDYMWVHHSGPEAIDPTRYYDIPEKVHAALPNIKLLVSLRNPVDRAVSAFHHNRLRGRIPVRASLRDMSEHFGILSMGRYDLQLAEWMKLYDRDRFKILIYEEDIKPDRAKVATLNRVFDHLGVSRVKSLPKLDSRVNARLDPAFAYLNQVPVLREKYRGQQVAEKINGLLPTRIQSWLRMDIPQADLDFLAEEFAPHNRRLEEMLERKLPW